MNLGISCFILYKTRGLIKAFNHHKDEYVRVRAARALGVLHSVEAVESLITMLKDVIPNVQERVAIALGEIGDAREVESLIARLLGDADALSKIGDLRAVEALATNLKSTSPSVCEEAIFALKNRRCTSNTLAWQNTPNIYYGCVRNRFSKTHG